MCEVVGGFVKDAFDVGFGVMIEEGMGSGVEKIDAMVVKGGDDMDGRFVGLDKIELLQE